MTLWQVTFGFYVKILFREQKILHHSKSIIEKNVIPFSDDFIFRRPKFKFVQFFFLIRLIIEKQKDNTQSHLNVHNNIADERDLITANSIYKCEF